MTLISTGLGSSLHTAIHTLINMTKMEEDLVGQSTMMTTIDGILFYFIGPFFLKRTK